MSSLVINPRNEDEMIFVQNLLQKLHIRSTVLDNEEKADIKAFDKALKRIKDGKAEFFTFEQVKQKLKI